LDRGAFWAFAPFEVSARLLFYEAMHRTADLDERLVAGI
jgi:hypothetical protein